MSLNMMSHVSGDFVTHKVRLERYAARYIDHKSALALEYDDSFNANIQPASDREIEFLGIGAERVNDVRIVHRNDGKGILVSAPDNLADLLIFSDGVTEETYWKSVNTDFRPWRNFCRATVVRLDPSEIEKLMRKVVQ